MSRLVLLDNTVLTNFAVVHHPELVLAFLMILMPVEKQKFWGFQ